MTNLTLQTEIQLYAAYNKAIPSTKCQVIWTFVSVVLLFIFSQFRREMKRHTQKRTTTFIRYLNLRITKLTQEQIFRVYRWSG